MFPLLIIGFMTTAVHTGSAVSEVSVLEGRSVTLNVTGHEDKTDLKSITWTVNEAIIVVYTHKYKDADIMPSFKDRVEFDKNTFSLLLRKLRKNDSGCYRVEKADTEKKLIVGEYQVTVWEPVSAPTLTVVSNWISSDSCNVTLSCTGLNVSLISICNGTFCSQEGGSRFLSISLNINTNTVSCNHSNPVSWEQTTMHLTPLCPPDPHPTVNPNTDGHMAAVLVPVGLVALVVIVVIVIVWVWWKRAKADTDGQGQSERGNRQDAAQQPMTAESTEMIENTYAEAVSEDKDDTETPTTVYDTVQLTRTPDPPSTEHAHRIQSNPETIYAVVKKKDCHEVQSG